MFLALQIGDWLFIAIGILIVGSVVGGMVKFVQGLAVLRRGRPVPDERVRLEQEMKDYE